MTEPTVGVTVSGGQVQGIAGAGSVVIENFTIYNRAAEEPATPATAADTEPIAPCPYPGLAYFGPDDADRFFGRDAAITRLAEAIGRQSFTALVGASVRIPMIATTDSDGSRPAVPIDRDQGGAGAEGAVG